MASRYKLETDIDHIYHFNLITTTTPTTTPTTTTTTIPITSTTTTMITTMANRLEFPPVFYVLIILLLIALSFFLILIICCICYLKRKPRRQVTIQEPVNERAIAREETMYLTAPSSEMTFPRSSIRESFISAESDLLNEPKTIKYNETFCVV